MRYNSLRKAHPNAIVQLQDQISIQKEAPYRHPPQPLMTASKSSTLITPFPPVGATSPKQDVGGAGQFPQLLITVRRSSTFTRPSPPAGVTSAGHGFAMIFTLTCVALIIAVAARLDGTFRSATLSNDPEVDEAVSTTNS